MKFNTFKLFTVIFLNFLLIVVGVNGVSAVDCAAYKGSQGPHVSGKYNGYACSNPDQYNQVTKCIGTSGNRYIVTYCTASGCEEEYPEQGPSAPALCNRPDQVQSGVEKVFGQVVPPVPIQQLGFGAAGISNVLNKFIILIYTAAGIIAVFMVLFSAFQWITSGGDKEAVSKARARLTYVIIGIALLSFAFVVLNLIGNITGFTFFKGQVNP